MLNLPRLGVKFYVGAGLMASLGLSGCLSPESIVDDGTFETVMKRPGEPPIAIVKGTYIYGSDVSWQAEVNNLIAPGEMLARTDPRFDKALQELIDQRLLALSSLERGLDTQGWTQRRLSLARERILSSVALEDHLAKTVTDRTVRAAYDRQVKLGRNVASFEESRDRIRALLTAEEVQNYLVFLRERGNIEILKTNTVNALKTGHE